MVLSVCLAKEGTELRPGRRALVSSLSAVADGGKPDTPPLLDNLVMWGYATEKPVALTAVGIDVLNEMKELISADGKPQR